MGMRFFTYALVAVVSSAVTSWMFLGGHSAGPSKTQGPPTFDFTYSDFVFVLLTALGVILAALAIIIGIVAFRTIGEIKREAGKIATEHSRTATENALQSVPDRVAIAVKEIVDEKLPGAIDNAVEKAGQEGRLHEALEKVMMQFSSGDSSTDAELQPEFEGPVNEEDTNA